MTFRGYDLTGKKFGRLTVLGMGDRELRVNGGTIVRWRVRCDCGVEKQVPSIALRRGLTKSCGCYRLEKLRGPKGSKLQPGESQRNEFLCHYKQGARERQLEWGLSTEEFDVLIRSQCHYCGVSPITRLVRRERFGSLVVNGIDRKDNAQGYTSDNVVPCCKICNRAKLTLGYEEFIAYLKLVCRKEGACWVANSGFFCENQLPPPK